MSRRNGFTVAELVITISVFAILIVTAFPFFNNTLHEFFTLQQEGLRWGQLADQSQRIAKVLRGLTDITQATDTELTTYAYFAPSDQYVSLIHYYKNAQGTKLYADVTPMSSNPPSGTPIAAQMRTITVIDNFFTSPTVKLFEYLDSSNATLAVPIADLHTIKGIRVNLSVPVSAPSQSGNDTVTVQVSLRNRKTNL